MFWHMNGLLKQFFPKQINFKIVKPEALEKAIMLINKRSGKTLDHKTPFEVFSSDKSDADALRI
jgi:IS30 family transposase